MLVQPLVMCYCCCPEYTEPDKKSLGGTIIWKGENVNSFLLQMYPMAG